MAREQRRLAAILFADVVGSSRLMGRDESGTVARLLEHLNRRFAPAAARHGGRVIRLTGDGGLAEFPSAVDALGAAIEFQQAMIEANREQPEGKAIVFRIGLHLGDVIVEGDDIYGDDVNIAARLEAEAPPGGIVVSRAVREAVAGRLKVSFHTLGDLTLKNIERPIRAFRVEWSAADWPARQCQPRFLHGRFAATRRTRGPAATFHCGSAFREHRWRSRTRVFRRWCDRELDYRSVAHGRHAGYRTPYGLQLQGKTCRSEADRPRSWSALCARRLRAARQQSDARYCAACRRRDRQSACGPSVSTSP